MFKNHLKIAWRNLVKDKTFTLINIIGLSMAFAVAILLVMDTIYEFSYNNFHVNSNRLFQTYTVQQTPKGPQSSTSQPTPFAMALQSEVPGVDKITRYLQEDALTIYDEKEINLNAIWVDADFFSMFTFPVYQGNKNNPLEDLSSVVITETTSKKLFGSSDPIGKTINILIKGNQKPFTVTAVTKDNPDKSTLEFEIAVRFENNSNYYDTRETWDAQYHEVYVQLEKGVLVPEFEKNSRMFTNLHYKGVIENLKRDGATADLNGQFLRLGLIPIIDVHFTSFENGYPEISRGGTFLVLGVAFLILFIACVNYINMSIARSSHRIREIGLRKILGAQKKQLFLQFWIESLFVFIFSLSFGIVLSMLMLNDFQTMFRTTSSLKILLSPDILLSAIMLVLTITLIVGGYPAFLLSRVDTIQSLKGKLESSGKNHLRNALMILQFGIAILLISGTLVLWGQVNYMQNKDLGYDKDQVFSFPLDGKMNSYDVIQLLKEEIQGNPDIIGVSAADSNLGIGKDGSQSNSQWGFGYKGRVVVTHRLVVDYDYLETLGLEIVQGRTFDSNRDNEIKAVIINESMAKELGEENPLTARLPANDSLSYRVVGVVKDYNFQDISSSIEPLTIFFDKNLNLYYAYVKVSSNNISNSVEAIEQAYKKIEPNADFLESFLDENVDRTFRREKTMAALITSSSVIAITLSCIGLFAISLLIVTQRTKEIGVRKVLGASVVSISVILTRDFLKLVLFAFFIAAPIAWWLLSRWLENYAYKIELSIWFFVAASILTMIMAILTVSGRTIKAATQNPVESLKTE